MSNCEATEDVKKIIRAMAKAKLEEGITDAHDIVDAIHEAINEHTPLWKNEIADIISGYGKKSANAQATLSDLQQRIVQLKRDLREAYHPKPPPKGKPAPRSPEEIQNQRRQTQIKKEIADLQDRIARKDFTKPQRKPPQYDAATQKLQTQLESSRRLADRELRKLEYQNKSRVAKIADTFLAFHRAMILSGLGTLEHLTGAATSRLIFAPIEDVAGGLLHYVPGVRKYSEEAPTEGGPLSLSALGAGYGKTFSKQTLIDMRDKVMRGFSDLQAVMKDPYDSNHRLLDMVGHIHDALKTPAENFAYAKALVTQAQQARKALARAGKTSDEIDRALMEPAMIAKAQANAYEQALRAKLQGDNLAVKMYQAGQRILQSQGKGGEILAGIMNYMLPIVKIPTNLADEVLSYAAGELRAAGAAGLNGKKSIEPELADYVMRNLKKGLVGKALAVVAWLGYKAFGAMYDDQRRKRAGEPDYGDIRINGHTIPKQLLHSPAFTLMMAVALARRVYEQKLMAESRKGVPQEKPEAAASGAGHAAIGVLNTIPFLEQPQEFYKALHSGSGMSNYLGQQVASNEPQALKDIAKWTDPEGALKRHPEGFLQQAEVGIPGLRERVPLQDIKHMTLDAKLDVYDKMTPAEREKTALLESINTTAMHSRTITPEQQKRIEAMNQ